MHFCIRSKDKYIAAVRKFKIDSYFHKDGHPAVSLPQDILLIEEQLPLPTLLLFREEATKSAAVEIRKQLEAEKAAAAAAAEKASASSLSSAFSFSSSTSKSTSSTIDTSSSGEKKSFFSGWFGSKKKEMVPASASLPSAGATSSPVSPPGPSAPSSPPATIAKKLSEHIPDTSEDVEDEKLMNDLEVQLQRLNEASKAAINQKFSFRGTLHSSAVITATYDGGPLATIRAGMGLLIETRYSNVLLNFSLFNFSIEDQITQNPFDKMLIVMAERQNTLALTDKDVTGQVEKADNKNITGQVGKVPFTFILEIRPDLLSLRFIALPVIITWNKDCIKYFIHFITSATNDDSKADISPLLKSSLEQFSAEAALPKVDTEIIIDIDAPKIIMPEGQGRTPSYMVLDAGYLSMRGLLNQRGMSIQIALRKVNISMPDTSMTTLVSSPYLITPFDFEIDIKSKDEVNPVVYVDMNLLPRLSADLDAIKLVRIVQVILILLESFDTTSLDPVVDEDGPMGITPIALDFDAAAVASHDQIARIKKTDITEVRKKRPVDFSVLKVRSTFSLSELVMKLYISPDHMIELVLKDVFLSVFQRAGDSSIETAITSLDINDSKRTPDHPSILLAKPEENSTSDKLLTVVYRTVSDKRSPYYRGNSAELLIDITRVRLYMDCIFIKNFAPLLTDFMNAWIAKIIPIQEAQAAAAAATKSRGGPSLSRKSDSHFAIEGTPAKRSSWDGGPMPPTTTTPVKKAEANPLGGMYLEFAMDSVGLYLLQPRYKKPEGGDALSEDILDRFESSFLFNMSKFDVKITAGTKTVVKATLSAIDLIDLRQRSEKNVFKKILRTGKMFDADDMDQDPTVRLHEHLLYVTFEQDERGNSSVDVTVRNLSTIVAVDVVMDLVEIIMADVESILVIIADIQNITAGHQQALSTSRKQQAITDTNTAVSVEDGSSVVPRPATDFVLSVSVINPRLILLEDPCSGNSKAIQTRCGIFLRYVIHDAGGMDNEQRGSFHMSVRDIETFAILDLSKQTAVHRIIEPLGVEVHFNNKVIRSKMVSMQINVSIQDIFLRVSLNDIVMVQNIFMRVGEVAMAKAAASVSEVDMESKQVRKAVGNASDAENLTIYGIRVTLDHLNAILINDYNGQNSPLIRFDATDLEFGANGAHVSLEGDGSVTLVSEYYNSPLGCWEPVMERWKPTVGFRKDSTGILLQINHNRLLQFNVTGELLKCIVGAVALVARIGKEGSYKSRKDTIPLTFRNELGIPVEIVDHKSKQLLASLAATSASDDMPPATETGSLTGSVTGGAISPGNGSNKMSVNIDAGFDLTGIPEVDIYLTGDYADVYAPLQRLSTRSRKPKVFRLHSLTEEDEVTPTMDIVAPVIEEVYQYSRFNLIKNAWEQPWSTVGDPNEWADAFGKGNKNPRTFRLPSSWEWFDKEWQIDMNGVVGKEIDKDGWEYATNFPAFSLNNARRCKSPADCVRRRRWIRRRVIHQTVHAQVTKAMVSTIVWEVLTNSDESKTLVLKSTKIVKNDLPVDMEIAFDTSARRGKYVVPSRSSLSLRLEDTHQVSFVIRPRDRPMTAWSAPMPFVADGVKTEMVEGNKCDDQQLNSLWFGYFLMARDGIFTVIVRPVMEVHNFLPCGIQCRFSSRDGSSDGIEVQAGESMPITACSVYDQIPTTLICGSYSASEVFRVPNRDESYKKTVLLYGPDDLTTTITVRLKTNAAGVLSLILYSTLLFVDKSGLNLALCVQKPNPVQRGGTGQYTFEVAKVIDPHVGDNEPITPLSWAIGAHGLALFEPGDQKFAIATRDGFASMKNLTIESFGASKTNHEIYDSGKDRFYHVAVKCEPYPLAADLSHVLTIMPGFHIVNCLNESLVLRQKDSMQEQRFMPRQTTAWHSPGSSVESNILVRSEGTDWSIGTININEIGTTSLVLPNLGESNPNGNNFRVINCEVRFSEPDDPSYITVVIWESSIRRNVKARKFIFDSAVTMSVRNDTAVPLIVRQAGVNVYNRLRDQRRNCADEEVMKFEAFVHPGEWIPYGWTDPDANMELEISIPSSIADRAMRPLKINMMEIGSQGSLDISALVQQRQVLTAKVRTHSNGRVLTITGNVPAYEVDSLTNGGSSNSLVAMVRDPSNDFALSIKVQTISISIIADKPQRRELFSLYLEKLSFFLQNVAKGVNQPQAQLMEFKVQDLQIDNFSETAVYPVLLTSLGAQERKERKAKDKSRSLLSGGMDALPDAPGGGAGGASLSSKDNGDPYLNCFECSMYQEVPEDQNTPILKSVAFRLLELNVTLDSATILVYVTDLHSDILERASNRQLTDKLALTLDAQEFNDKVFTLLQSDRLQNIEWQYTISQQNKMFIEHLVIHPMRVSLSFYPTKFPRSTKAIHPSLRWMRSLENVTSVEGFELKIKSYIASNVMEPLPRLMESIGTKITREIQSNLIKIAGNLVGSLSLLGKPAGLYKKIGSGVEDFFYEPYQGLMESPTGFVTGIGKGTSRLISGVASGVVGSASNIVGTASGGVASVARGVARMSGDEKLVQRSEDRRRELKASGGGVMAGLKAGGESVVSGFQAGISGLVTKPFEEGRKGGAMGFLKGVGQGIIGVAVNPVMGVTEGISSVAQGINRSFANEVGTVHVRPKRAFYRRDPEVIDELVLCTINVFQAEAQNFVDKRALKKNYSDVFIAATTMGFPSASLGEDDPYGLVLSRQFFYLVSPKFKLLWVMQLSVISHIELNKLADGRFTLKIVEYDLSPGLLPRQVVCLDKRAAADAYDTFVHFRRYFGNPNRMEPSENILELLGEGKGDSSKRRSMQIGSGSGSVASSPRPGLASANAAAGVGSVIGSVSSPSLASSDSPPLPISPGPSTPRLPGGYSGDESPAYPSRPTSMARGVSGSLSVPGPAAVPEYIFGAANAARVDSDRMNERQILRRASDMLLERCRVPLPVTRPEDRHKYHKLLDQVTWNIICDWNANHDMIISPSRCCLCLVINHSRSSIQLLRTELREGADLVVFGVGDGYDPAARTLRAHGGAVVVFAKGNRPSLVSKEHVKFDVATTAFEAMMATRENRSECTPQAGYHAPFLEKSRTDWWAKYVIVVS